MNAHCAVLTSIGIQYPPHIMVGLPRVCLILVVIAHIGLQLLTDLQGFIDPAGGDHLLTIKNAAIFNHYPKAQGISQCAIHAAGNRWHIGSVYSYIGIVLCAQLGPDILLYIVLKGSPLILAINQPSTSALLEL